MRRTVKYSIPCLLLAGIAVLCVIRWQAWFGMPEEPVWTGETLDYTFPSFAQDTTPESLDMLVLGDVHNALTTADYDTLAQRVPQADIVLQTGDWMDRGQNYYYQSLLHEWTRSQLLGLPVFATPGNHEYSKGIFTKELSPVWQHAFTYPHNGPKDVPGVHAYIDLPHTRVISIDTNPLVRLVHLTRTLTWLRATLQSAGNRYVIVIMHHPVISAAKWRWNPLIHATFRNALGDADLVLAGHDHLYMRKNNMVVINTGGEKKEQRDWTQPQVTSTEPAYAVVSVNDQQLVFKAYRLDNGAVIDSLYVKHH